MLFLNVPDALTSIFLQDGKGDAVIMSCSAMYIGFTSGRTASKKIVN